jgi:hypothetical protein
MGEGAADRDEVSEKRRGRRSTKMAFCTREILAGLTRRG